MTHKLIIIILILFSKSLISQNINCIVVNKNNEPLEYVNIFIKNSNIGTVSNKEGAFSLKDNNITDTLVLSYIGYQTKRITIKELNKQKNDTILLDVNSFKIDEIVIKPPKVERIIYNVLINTKKNYPSKRYNTESFYREILKVDTDIYQLTEASCLFENYPFYIPNKNKHRYINTSYWTKGLNDMFFDASNILEFFQQDSHYKEKVKIEQLRKSDNLTKGIFKINLSGGPLRITSYDVFRQKIFPFNAKKNYKKYKTEINKKFIVKYKYLYQDTSLIYKISLTTKDNTERYTLFINDTKHVILKYTISINNKIKTEWPLDLVYGIYNTELKDTIYTNKPSDFTFQYKEYKNKWFLNYAESKIRYSFYRDRYGKEKNIEEHRLLVTNKIYTDTLIEINEDENFDDYMSNYLFNTKMPYSEKFWNNYITIVPTKLEQQVISKIEKYNSLNNQFVENGNTQKQVAEPSALQIPDTLINYNDTIIDPYLYMAYNDSLKMRYINNENKYFRYKIKDVKTTINTFNSELLELHKNFKKHKNNTFIHKSNYSIIDTNNQFYIVKNYANKESFEYFYNLNKLHNKNIQTLYGTLKVSQKKHYFSIMQYQNLAGYRTFFINIESKEIIDTLNYLQEYFNIKNSNYIYYTKAEKSSFWPKYLLKYNLSTKLADTIFTASNDTSLNIMLTNDSKYLILNKYYYLNLFDTNAVLQKFKFNNYFRINHYNNYWIKWVYDTNKYLSLEYKSDTSSKFTPFIKNSGYGDIGEILIKDSLVFFEEQRAFTKNIKVKNIENNSIKTITQSNSDIYSFSLSSNTNNKIYINYNEYFKPSKYYYYSIKSDSLIYYATDSLKNVNLNNYEAKIIYVKSKNNYRIPVLLKYKKGIKLKGKNKLILETYGAGVEFNPQINLDEIPMLNRNYIFAWAMVHGEVSPGMYWGIDSVSLSINDFETVLLNLINKNYTSKDKLFIRGTSNGGKYIANAVNNYPNKIKGASLNVPYVDILYSYLNKNEAKYSDKVLKTKNDYFNIKQTSPYNNIKKQEYPNSIVFSGLFDANVKNYSVARYVAKIRANNTNNNLIIFNTFMNSGHFLEGDDELYRISMEYAFFNDLIRINNK